MQGTIFQLTKERRRTLQETILRMGVDELSVSPSMVLRAEKNNKGNLRSTGKIQRHAKPFGISIPYPNINLMKKSIDK